MVLFINNKLYTIINKNNIELVNKILNMEIFY